MDDQAQPTVSAHDLLIMLIRRRRLVAIVFAAGVLTLGTLIFTTTPRYRASAKILLSTNRANVSTSPDAPTELVRDGRISPEELNTQREILLSRALVAEVLSGSGEGNAAHSGGTDSSAHPSLAAPLVTLPVDIARSWYRQFHELDPVGEDSSLDQRVASILQHLTVTALNRSNVIEVAFTSPNPVRAREFVTDLTAAYVEQHAQLRLLTEAEEFFNGQSRLLHQRLETSEARLREAREKAGAAAGERAQLAESLSQLTGELTDTAIARAELEGRVRFLESRDTTEGPLPEKIATPQLLALEGERAALVGRFRPDSERRRILDKQITALRSAIGSYDAIVSPTGDATTATLDARAELAAVTAKEAALLEQVKDYRQRTKAVEARAFDIARFERQVQSDEEAYLSYVRAAEEARLANAIEQTKLLRLTVIEPATTPIEPTSPNIPRLLSFGLLTGLAFSIGIALALEFLDTTVKTSTDVRRYGNLEVLAVVEERPQLAARLV